MWIYFSAWFIAICLLWSRMFYSDGTNYWAGWTSIWGDWQMHIPIVLNFAYQPFPLPFHPLFSGEPFRYHFVADFISGVLIKLGISLEQAMILPSIIFSMFLVVITYHFFFTLFRKKMTAIISSLLFFFSGGLGYFIYIYRYIIQKNPLPAYPPLVEVTNMKTEHIEWINVWTSAFIPQRATLLGVPITIIVLVFFWKLYTSDRKKIPFNQLFVAGVVTGIMPIIHIHSYFVLLLVAAFVIIISSIADKLHGIHRWLFFIIPAILVSSIVFTLFYKGIPSSDIQFQLDWIGGSTIISFIHFWLLNIGIMFFLIPYGYIKSDLKIKFFYIPFLILFIVANVLTFQKFQFDNKFLLYWYLMSSGLVGNLFAQVIAVKNYKKTCIVLILFFMCIISGFTDFTNLYNHEKQKMRLFSAKDLVTAEKVRALSTSNEIFMTAPTNTWFGMTIGRPITMTFDWWLNGHGLKTNYRINEINAIYRGEQNANELIKKNKIDYIVIGPMERQMYVINEVYFHQFGLPFFENETYTIYDVRRIQEKTSQTVE